MPGSRKASVAAGMLLSVSVMAGSALAGGVLAGGSAPPALDAEVVSSVSPPAPTPIVDNNRILDSRTGDTFVPHGVNWPSFEYACSAPTGRGWGYSQGTDTKAAADAMASWHINTVRIPLNQDCWLGANASHNYGTAAGYQAALRSWVDILHSDGIVTILDLHWNAPAGKLAEDQYPMPDAQSLDFWTGVATAYRGDPAVIFDAFNEPYSRWNNTSHSWDFQLTWDCWRNGGCNAPDVSQSAPTDGHTYPVVGMSALVAAIRTAGAQQPIMLGGIDYSNDLTGWLAHKPADGQLIASWHNYPGQDCHTIACWDTTIAPVARVVPVVTGEIGETDGKSTYLTGFMPWADSHGIGYLPWAWWDVSANEDHDDSLYALYSGSRFTPKAPSGTAYHDHLAVISRTTTALAVANAGFEGSLSGWKRHSDRLTLGLGAIAGRAHTGTGYLTARASTEGRGFQQAVTTTVRVGDNYTATIWLRTSSAVSEAVVLTLVAEGGTAEHARASVKLTRTWKKFTVKLAVKHTSHRDIRLAVYLQSTHRTIDADDAALSVAR